MQTIRDGEVWFSSLNEALEDARQRNAGSRRKLAPKTSEYVSLIGFGALAVLGLALFRDLARA